MLDAEMQSIVKQAARLLLSKGKSNFQGSASDCKWPNENELGDGVPGSL